MAVVAQDSVVVFVVSILLTDDPVAILAGVVIPIIAGSAKMAAVLVAGIVLDPDSLAAASAHDGAVLQTIRADQGVIKFSQFFPWMKGMTDPTFLQLRFHFAHIHTSKIKSARSVAASGFLYG
jgi:hypothetical protein